MDQHAAMTRDRRLKRVFNIDISEFNGPLRIVAQTEYADEVDSLETPVYPAIICRWRRLEIADVVSSRVTLESAGEYEHSWSNIDFR